MSGKKLTVEPARDRMATPNCAGGGRGGGGGRRRVEAAHNRAGSLEPSSVHSCSGEGLEMKRRGFNSHGRRRSSSGCHSERERRKGGEPTKVSNGGGLNLFSSIGSSSGDYKREWDHQPHDKSCDLSTPTCDQCPKESSFSTGVVWDCIPVESCDRSNKSSDQQPRHQEERRCIPSGADFVEGDIKSLVPANRLSPGKLLNVIGPKWKVSAADEAYLVAMANSYESDDEDSLKDFEWDDSLIDDVELSSYVPPASTHPPLLYAPPSSPPPLTSLSLSPPTLLEEDSLPSGYGSVLPELDRASNGAESESLAADVRECASQRSQQVGVVTDLVAATVSRVSG